MFNKENVDLFNSKILLLLNNIIPGIIILEVFFKFGFFSKTPENIFSFIIYLIWAYLLSLPFNLFDSLNFEKLVKKVIKNEVINLDEKEKEIINKGMEKHFEEEKEEMNKFNDLIQFLFILCYTILTYVAYKFLNNYFLIISFWNINLNFFKLFICLLIVIIITIPLRYIVNKLFINYLKKEFTQNQK